MQDTKTFVHKRFKNPTASVRTIYVSSARSLLATNAANTVVILRIGCGASAVRRCPLRAAGFLPSIGRSLGSTQADGRTTACTAVEVRLAPQPSFPGGSLRTSPLVHRGTLPGCGGKNRSVSHGCGIPCTHILPGGCHSSNGSLAQRVDRSYRR